MRRDKPLRQRAPGRGSMGRVRPLLDRAPFFLELFLNGTFALLYSLRATGRVPGGWDAGTVDWAIGAGARAVPLVLLLQFAANALKARDVQHFVRKYVFSVVILVPLLITWGDAEFAFWLSLAHLLSSVLVLYDDPAAAAPRRRLTVRSIGLLQRLGLGPARLVMLSFGTVIAIGTLLLMLPVAKADGSVLPFVDALFLATSATCVTGLTTLSIGSELSAFGQVVVLVLVQVGGLSIMTLYSSMTVLLGRTMGVKGRIIMQDLLEAKGLDDLVVMITSIVKYTIVIEALGALVLSLGFLGAGLPPGAAIYNGVFHAVSAFCNAGLSLSDSSLEPYGTSPLVHGPIAALVTLGGLGFIVLKELEEVAFKGKKIVRMGLHTKVVLTTTIVLTVASALLFFFGEFLDSLAPYTLWEKVQISVFQSVTLRTAGFSTVPLTSLNSYTLYMMSLFMFIGGSPGSTAGGVKTTTLAILIQSIHATLKGKRNVELFDRTVSPPIVVRATALTFISIIIASCFIFVLMKIEPEQSFLTLFFETVSASATVGLSLGVTPYLSAAGKVAVLALMYIGRIGPLTLLLAIGQEERRTGKFDYPTGRIMIG